MPRIWLDSWRPRETAWRHFRSAVVAAWATEKLGSYTWGIFITAQASLVAMPLFVVAFRRYRTDLARSELVFEGSTP